MGEKGKECEGLEISSQSDLILFGFYVVCMGYEC